MTRVVMVLFLLISLKVTAGVKATVSNGDWFNPAIWSPNGVPMFEDTVIINHSITVSGSVDYSASWMIINPGASLTSDTTFALHGNLKIFGDADIKTFGVGDGDSALVYGYLTGGISALSNPYNINYGTINCDTLTLGDGFINSGLIDILQLVAGGSYFTNSAGAAIVVSFQSIFSGSNSTNIEANSTMSTEFLVTNSDMTNNGDITATNWTHGSGTISGSTGKFCVSQCFINNSSITGTVDICDVTPGGFCDVNMGSIAGTVTYCVSGSCASNVDLEEIGWNVAIYPNPASEYINVETEGPYNELWLNDMNGRPVLNKSFNKTIVLDLSELEAGTYLLILSGKNTLLTRKVIHKF